MFGLQIIAVITYNFNFILLNSSFHVLETIETSLHIKIFIRDIEYLQVTPHLD
jgi:hypothetical protein